jgi:hypothetical protein
MFGDSAGSNVRQAPPATRSIGGEVGGNAPIPTSVVSHELERANRLGGDIHNLLDRLEQRLVPLCHPAPPNGHAGDAASAASAPTELSRAVQGINSVNASACERLASILDRIDL